MTAMSISRSHLAPIPGLAYLRRLEQADTNCAQPAAGSRAGCVHSGAHRIPIPLREFERIRMMLQIIGEVACRTRPINQLDDPAYSPSVRRQILRIVNSTRSDWVGSVGVASLHVMNIPGAKRYEFCATLRLGKVVRVVAGSVARQETQWKIEDFDIVLPTTGA